MNAFYNIIQECANIKSKKYPSSTDFDVFSNSSRDNTHMDVHLLMYKLDKKLDENEKCNMNNLKSVANAKFLSLKHDIICHKNEELYNIFTKAQKCYFGFSLLSKMYKQKKSSIVVKDDLMLNPLDTKNKQTFFLTQNNSIYMFSIRDLANIIETALSQNDSFFLTPVRPKNPYNNMEFSNADLYNIYFKMKETSLKMQHLFHEYFLCNFDINVFSFENEALLRRISIKNFIFNTPYKILINPVLRMLHSNFNTRFLNIHEDFPKEKLVSIFRDHVYYYYMIEYSLETTNKINGYKKELDKKLKEFYLFNPFFGKRMIKYENFSTKTEFIFNDDHINFYGKATKNIFEGKKLAKKDENEQIIGFYIVKYDESTTNNEEESENVDDEYDEDEDDEDHTYYSDDDDAFIEDDEQQDTELFSSHRVV